MKSYFRMIGLLKPHGRLLIAAIVCMVASSAFEGVSLGAIIPLVDIILAGKCLSLPASDVPAGISALVDTLNQMPREELLNYLIVAVLVLFVLKELFISILLTVRTSSWDFSRSSARITSPIAINFNPYPRIVTSPKAFMLRVTINSESSLRS